MNRFFKQIFFAAVTLFLFAQFAAAQAGAVDPNFNGSAYSQPNGFVYAVARQPADGKILVGGTFTVAGGEARSLVARFDQNGNVDPSFNAAPLTGTARVIVVQPNGDILVGGTIFGAGAETQVVVRLKTDGSLDASFQLAESANGVVNDIALLPDGKIVVAGDFGIGAGGVFFNKLARLNADGSLDSTFVAESPAPLQEVEAQPDGKIIAGQIGNGSNLFLRRYNSNGSEDQNFTALFTGTSSNGFGPTINGLKLQPDGKVLVGGNFGFANNSARSNLVRLNVDGTLDESFNANPSTLPTFIYDIELDPTNGKIVVVGGNSAPVDPSKTVVRLETSGARDTTFNFVTDPALPVYIGYEALVLPDGRIIVAGYRANSVVTGGTAIRVNQNGTTDNSFKALTGREGFVNEIVAQPDGKVLIAGSFGAIGNVERRSFARLNFDGSPDTTFVPALAASSIGSYTVTAIALQTDGKIIVGGNFVGSLARLNSDGSRDTTFNPTVNFSPEDVAVQPDGKIIAVGSVTSGNVARFNADGSTDAAFAAVTVSGGRVNRVVLQPDGKILIGGNFTIVNGSGRGGIARLNADGTLDNSFNPLGGVSGTVLGIALQSDGKVVIVGSFGGVNGAVRNNIARLNPNGTLDASFTASVNTFIYDVELQSNGKILIGGAFVSVNGEARNRIARLNPNGTNDAAFQIGTGATGQNSQLAITALALATNGRIYAGGSFSKFNEVPKIGIVRLQNDAAGRTPFDFDGDGRADLSVFRPSNGAWYLQQSANGFAGQLFGLSQDRIVPGDYDGDGRTDLAVYRGGTWYLQRSTLGFTGINFGLADDLPVPADYDADGKTDIAVFRPSNGFWYRLNSSSGQFVAVNFGLAGDKPTLGDFDGNGSADIAVFRPSNGVWYRLDAQGQTVATQFGQAGDLVVPADYDGDGRTDIAVFRPSNSAWYILRSTFGLVTIEFGTSGDKPVPADYDGDAQTDVAVYRPSNGVWYLLRSTQGFTGAAFGVAEDNPIPNAFVR